jgi:hypothetical protein
LEIIPNGRDDAQPRVIDVPPNEQVPTPIIVVASSYLGILAIEIVRIVSRPVRQAAAANRQA